MTDCLVVEGGGRGEGREGGRGVGGKRRGGCYFKLTLTCLTHSIRTAKQYFFLFSLKIFSFIFKFTIVYIGLYYDTLRKICCIVWHQSSSSFDLVSGSEISEKFYNPSRYPGSE